MAGTLVVDSLKASSGVLATQNGMTGIAKAWVNFNGTTTPPNVRASYNVSSVTRTATANYTISFTTSMASANYALSGCASTITGYVGLVSSVSNQLDFGKTTSGFNVASLNNAGYVELPSINVSVFSA